MRRGITGKLVTKASASPARYKVSAAGFTKKGNLLHITMNSYYMPRRQGGMHAEEQLIHKYQHKLHTILICRTSRSGDKILPIHPCSKCRKLADKYNIKIISLSDILLKDQEGG